ncbi:MAG: hypothetical protein PF549_02795 [Patescibacteria group bacterium]|jgi:hypothetical protein|nr:hypothetical protein [Patescibacteria group bacterium]
MSIENSNEKQIDKNERVDENSFESNKKITDRSELTPEKIEKKNEIIERCGETLEYVYNLYDNYEPLSSEENKDKLDKLKKHIGEEVLVFAVEEALRRGLDEEKCYLVGVSACLHDAGKAMDLPDYMKKIQGPVVEVYHHVLSCELIDDNKENIRKMFKNGYPNKNKDELSDEFIDKKIEIVKDAIMSHMGPNPGFMKNMLDNVVNPQLDKEKKITHPSPKEENIVAQILLAADMYSLANPNGVSKIMELRSDIENAPFFQKEDFELSYDYNRVSKKYKKNLLITVGEAAFISAYKSGLSAKDMFEEGTDNRKWIEKAISDVKKTKEFEYIFKEIPKGGEVVDKIEMKVNPKETIKKMEEYERLIQQEEIMDNIDNIK